MKTVKSIHGIFKPGDIVVSREYFGNKKFRIVKLFGNAYCPIMFCRSVKKDEIYNLFPGSCSLINAEKRPLKNIKMEIIVKLLRKGNLEAKREFIMRNLK